MTQRYQQHSTLVHSSLLITACTCNTVGKVVFPQALSLRLCCCCLQQQNASVGWLLSSPCTHESSFYLSHVASKSAHALIPSYAMLAQTALVSCDQGTPESSLRLWIRPPGRWPFSRCYGDPGTPASSLGWCCRPAGIEPAPVVAGQPLCAYERVSAGSCEAWALACVRRSLPPSACGALGSTASGSAEISETFHLELELELD